MYLRHSENKEAVKFKVLKEEETNPNILLVSLKPKMYHHITLSSSEF